MDQKALQFVQRLLANPALKPFTPLQREEQIITFLQVNAAQLYPTLSSPAFFPGESWQAIMQHLLVALMEIGDKAVVAGLQELFSSRINFHFFSFFNQSSADGQDRQQAIYRFAVKELSSPLSRRAFTGPYAALMLRLADRYIDAVFEGRGYIRFELEKVQRLSMSQEEIKNLVRCSMLLRPAVRMMQTAGRSDPGESRGLVTFQFAEKVKESLMKELPFVPEGVIESAVYSNVSFDERSDLPASGRLAALFSQLATDYRPGMKVDRGAVSQERSWFGVARKNHRYFGFDMKMADELYRLAAENGW